MISIAIAIWLLLGFFWLTFDEHFGGWIAMIAHNMPLVAIVLYLSSLIVWPLHMINSCYHMYRDYQWKKPWTQAQLHQYVEKELELSIDPFYILPQSIKGIAKQATKRVRWERFDDLMEQERRNGNGII